MINQCDRCIWHGTGRETHFIALRSIPDTNGVQQINAIFDSISHSEIEWRPAAKLLTFSVTFFRIPRRVFRVSNRRRRVRTFSAYSYTRRGKEGGGYLLNCNAVKRSLAAACALPMRFYDERNCMFIYRIIEYITSEKTE